MSAVRCDVQHPIILLVFLAYMAMIRVVCVDAVDKLHSLKLGCVKLYHQDIQLNRISVIYGYCSAR